MMFLRRRRLLWLAGTVSALAGVSRAQGVPTMLRIAHLSGSGESASRPFVDAFREGMREPGLLEGKNYVLLQRYSEGKVKRLAALAQELIAQKPDVLLTSTGIDSFAVSSLSFAKKIRPLLQRRRRWGSGARADTATCSSPGGRMP